MYHRPTENQVDDVIAECRDAAAAGSRVLITTLTKKMAEDLTEYMHEAGIRVRYLHSDVDTLEQLNYPRSSSRRFRCADRDQPVARGAGYSGMCLVAILDADKEGYLRSRTSLVQTIGRAARNVNGRVLLYADGITDSLDYALGETSRRRDKRKLITRNTALRRRRSTSRSMISSTVFMSAETASRSMLMAKAAIWSARISGQQLPILNRPCRITAANLEFEDAARIRDEIRRLEASELEIGSGLPSPSNGQKINAVQNAEDNFSTLTET